MTALRFQTGGDIRHPQPPFRGLVANRSAVWKREQKWSYFDYISALTVTLTLTIVSQFFWYHHTKFGLKSLSSSGDIVQANYMDRMTDRYTDGQMYRQTDRVIPNIV